VLRIELFWKLCISIDLIFIYKTYIILKVNTCLLKWTNRVTKTTYFLTSLIISSSTDLLKTMRTTKIVTKTTYFLHWLYSSHLITIFNIKTKCMVSTWSAFSTPQQRQQICWRQQISFCWDPLPVLAWRCAQALERRKGSFLLILGNFVFHFPVFSLQANGPWNFFFSLISIYIYTCTYIWRNKHSRFTQLSKKQRKRKHNLLTHD
jgi:hypothetical protein